MEPITFRELVNYAWENSNFYRNFWSRSGFNAETDFKKESDFNKIPIISKRDLLSVPVKDRVVLNSDNYYFSAISSGTTEHPLISLQQQFSVPPYYRFIESMLSVPKPSIFVLRPATHAMVFIGGLLPGKYFPYGSIFSVGNVSDLSFSCNLAREVGIDYLVSRASDAIRLAEALHHENYSTTTIKLLWITGEPLTRSAMFLLKRLYPGSLIYYVYAMTEGPSAMGNKSSLCSTLDTISPNAYHLNTRDFHFELLEGVSVVTALHRIPTPIIRYNTGDRVVVQENFKCSCGFPRGPIGIVGPRTENDSYKIGGLILQVKEVRKVLFTLSGLVTGDFALHVEQIDDEDKLSNMLRLVLRPVMTGNHVWARTVYEKLMRELKVSHTMTLRDAIARGYVKSFEVVYDPTVTGGCIVPPIEISNLFPNKELKL